MHPQAPSGPPRPARTPLVNHPHELHRVLRRALAVVAWRPRRGDVAGPRIVARRPILLAVIAAIGAIVAVGAGAAPAQNATRANAPLVPATNDATSPFAADPGSSLPVGLVPNQTVNPLVAPGQPVVLSWDPVPGAVSYDVEVSSS